MELLIELHYPRVSVTSDLHTEIRRRPIEIPARTHIGHTSAQLVVVTRSGVFCGINLLDGDQTL